jgi:hypothetical protein
MKANNTYGGSKKQISQPDPQKKSEIGQKLLWTELDLGFPSRIESWLQLIDEITTISVSEIA